MTQDSLVAINLIDIDGKLLNKTSVPLLYYWNGVSDVEDDLRNDETLCEYCNTLFINPEKYLDVLISYFYFTYSDDESENYNESTKDFQDIVYLEKFNSLHIVRHYILQHFLNLYKTSMKEEYNGEVTNVNDTIIDIYNTLKNKFKTRISKTTIINWVRSVLLDTNHFNSNNCDYIIKELKIILKDIE